MIHAFQAITRDSLKAHAPTGGQEQKLVHIQNDSASAKMKQSPLAGMLYARLGGTAAFLDRLERDRKNPDRSRKEFLAAAPLPEQPQGVLHAAWFDES